MENEIEQQKINLEEQLELQIYYYLQRKQWYNELLEKMDKTRERKTALVWCFKMYIYDIDKMNNGKDYEIPYEIQEKIFNLVYDFCEKQVRELDEKRDNAIKNYMEQKKNIDDTMNKNIKFIVEQTTKAEKLFDKLENNK